MKLKTKVRKNENILTFKELLERRFGKVRVSVVKWKWTKKQLEQLKKQE